MRSPSKLEINAAELLPQWVQVTLSAPNGSCSENTRSIDLFIQQAGMASIPDGSLTIWFDSGVAELSSPDLRDYQLVPVIGEKAGEPRGCSQQMSCTCNLSEEFLKELSEGSGKAAILLLPAAIPIHSGEPVPTVISASGSVIDRSTITMNPKRIVFSRSFIEAAKLDAASARHELSVRFSDAIDQMACDAAECRITKNGAIIFGIDPAASFINIRYTFKPKFFRRFNEKLLKLGNGQVEDRALQHKDTRSCALVSGGRKTSLLLTGAAQLHNPGCS